jgi:acyl carrier protein
MGDRRTVRQALRAGTRPGADLTRHHGQTDGDFSVTEQEIESKVIDIVAEQMGADKAKISRTTSFVDDLNADSLDTVELVMEFEDEFETSIPDDQAEKIKTVGEAIEFIKQAHGLE